jgi:diguanylate cyclase (GGDEF)-like protein/PAS domain S-box-containing protein
MSTLVLLCLLFGVAALALLTLFLLQRRDLRALRSVSLEVQRTAIGGSLDSRIELTTDQPELAALVMAVNHLLSRAAVAVERAPAPAPSSSVSIGALADRVHEAVLIQGQKIRYVNPQFARLVGAQPEELIGRRLSELVPIGYAELIEENLRRRLSGEPAAERYEVELSAAAGAGARLELSGWPIEYEGERAMLIVGVEVVPTQTIPTLESPAASSRSGMALDSLSEALMTTDGEGRLDYLNPAAERMLGITASEAEGRPFSEVTRAVEEADQKLLSEPVQQALSAGAPLNLGRRAVAIRSPQGTEHLIELSAAPLRRQNGETTGAVVLLHDVTESRGLARQMSYQATHDALTGLVNRREFERRLLEAIDTARRGDGAHVLCYLDLDHFKAVNDTGGHLAGDAMLREVAKLLRDAVRDSDTVGRLGGDEFGMLLVGCPLDKARQIADDVCRAVGEFRFVWKEKIFEIGVSIGLVEISRDSSSIEEVLAAADSACYVAKRQGGHVSVYSARDEIFARQTGEIQWLQTLQQALRDSRFELFYQSIIASIAANDEGPAMEVLVRLRDESGRQLPAIEFVRAAERYRLIAEVDRWVVQTTLTALGRGAISVPPKRSVAINISGQTLADAQFLEFAVDCFDTTGANPNQVCFEIAEDAVVGNLEQARRFIGVLHGMGCRFALDNFGSGLGSFSNLRNLAIDYLKIDGSFFKNLTRDSVNQAMVTAMVRLARTLNFKVIAERVEDVTALDAARQMGVDYLQGYAVARPAKLAMAA